MTTKRNKAKSYFLEKLEDYRPLLPSELFADNRIVDSSYVKKTLDSFLTIIKYEGVPYEIDTEDCFTLTLPEITEENLRVKNLIEDSLGLKVNFTNT